MIAQPAASAASELSIHSAIMRMLTLKLPADAVVHHSPNEGRRGWRAQAEIKATGVTAGWPDIEIVHGGRVYFLEVKSHKGRLSPRQKGVIANLERAGAPVVVVRSIDDAVAALKMWRMT